MKKLSVVLCLLLLCVALINSRAYAVFITDITNFVQDNGSTFTDTFGDAAEPPSGPLSGSDYVVEGTFGSTRESGGKLELNSDDGIMDMDEKFLAAAVKDSTYFFSSATEGQNVEGSFDFAGGLPVGTFFGIEILNFASVSGEISGDPVTDDEAWMGIMKDDTGIFAGWGDESQDGPLGFLEITSFLVDDTIGMKLEMIDNTNTVSALFDFGSGYGSLDPLTGDGISSVDFSTLSFISGDIYTGGFMAGEPIPEPATIVLFGIGLAGLWGGYIRRRLKRKEKP